MPLQVVPAFHCNIEWKSWECSFGRASLLIILPVTTRDFDNDNVRRVMGRLTLILADLQQRNGIASEQVDTIIHSLISRAIIIVQRKRYIMHAKVRSSSEDHLVLHLQDSLNDLGEGNIKL